MYVNTPICCPSRTETLSGRMYHNVLSPDLSGCMHVDQTRYIFQEPSALFNLMQKAGYREYPPPLCPLHLLLRAPMPPP